MVGKLDRVGRYLTFLKAEYGEAQAILGLDLSPAECAVALHQRFRIPIGTLRILCIFCYLLLDCNDFIFIY
jgi:hypothetical protein